MYYPVLKLNPFLELLYGGAGAAGVVVIPLSDIRVVDEIAWGDRTVIHLHWLHTLLSPAKSQGEAHVIVEEFAQTISGWKARGIKIVWTVHNVLPHRPRFPDAELALHQLVSVEADLVHVMNRQTPRLAESSYRLPDGRTVHVPHPSYAGWYGNALGRAQARQLLGIRDDEWVFLCFGSLQRYKGLMELVEAFESLRKENPARRVRLLIAGIVADTEYVKQLKQRAAACSEISIIARSIPEGHIQVYFNGADVIVAPYTRTLNSGVALLAATFRRPMVAPAMGAMTEVLGAEHPLLYDAAREAGLLDAMRQSVDHTVQPGYFDEILERHEPNRISALFFAEVKKMLDGKPRPRKGRAQGRRK